MPQMTPAQARIVDPVLSQYAQGYADPEFTGASLFPAVPVMQAGGQMIEFGKEAFQRYATERAPGTQIKRVQTGFLGRPYALKNHAFAGTVAVETNREAQAVPGVDLGMRAMGTALKVVQRELEIEQAALALNTANYAASHRVALAGTDKWSDPTSNPIAQISAYRETVRAACGRYPNVCHMSAQAWQAFSNNLSVIDRIKHTQVGILTEQLAAVLLQVQRVEVGKSIFADANGAFTDIWGNSCVLAFVGLGSKTQEEPSYGYTYVLSGHPAVMQGWYDPDTHAWVFPAMYERAPVLPMLGSGFLIQNPA